MICVHFDLLLCWVSFVAGCFDFLFNYVVLLCGLLLCYCEFWVSYLTYDFLGSLLIVSIGFTCGLPEFTLRV